jgi:acyl carrier protein
VTPHEGRVLATEEKLFMSNTVDVIIKLTNQFNKKGVAIGPGTTFAHDLELDSLTVMDLVASIEDEYDITLPLNLLPDLETVQQVADAVDRIVGSR